MSRVKTLDLEINNVGLSVDVEYEIDWDDAGGYSPPYDTMTIKSVTVTDFVDDSIRLTREERRDWFEVLDRIARDHIDEIEFANNVLESVH